MKTGTTTPGQSRPRSNSYKEVFHILPISIAYILVSISGYAFLVGALPLSTIYQPLRSGRI